MLASYQQEQRMTYQMSSVHTKEHTMSTEDVSLHDEEGNLLFDGEANPDSLRAILFDLMHALTKKEFVVFFVVRHFVCSPYGPLGGKWVGAN